MHPVRRIVETCFTLHPLADLFLYTSPLADLFLYTSSPDRPVPLHFIPWQTCSVTLHPWQTCSVTLHPWQTCSFKLHPWQTCSFKLHPWQTCSFKLHPWQTYSFTLHPWQTCSFKLHPWQTCSFKLHPWQTYSFTLHPWQTCSFTHYSLADLLLYTSRGVRWLRFFSSELFCFIGFFPPESRYIFCIYNIRHVFPRIFLPGNHSRVGVTEYMRKNAMWWVDGQWRSRLILALCHLYKSTFRSILWRERGDPSIHLVPFREPALSPRGDAANHLRKRSRVHYVLPVRTYWWNLHRETVRLPTVV